MLLAETGGPYFKWHKFGYNGFQTLEMIRNYITIAIRSMMRNKRYTFINIAGLSVGVACCLLLALYIQDELSYDRHHKDADRIYRITTEANFNKGRGPIATTSPPIAWGIKDEIPEFETVTRLVNPPGASQNLLRYEGNQFYEPNGYIADSTVFDIFTYEFVEGNARKALVHANSVVITIALAKKLFGNEPALDKVINITQNGTAGDFKITGVINDRFNGHIKPSFFISINSSGWGEYIRRKDVIDEWAGQNFMLSYVKLTPGHSVESVVSKMNAVFLKHGAEDLKALGFKKELGLQPLQDIYLRETTGNQNPRITYLYVVASIAIFILLIACINFMNLSTAKAVKRANEVGLRKSLGAHRTALVIQFLGEALVIVFIAIALSCIIVQLSLPLFNNVTGKHINLEGSDPLLIAAALMGITLITGLVAGSYPAFYLSSFEPANALKGKSALQSSNSMLRKSLVVFQFVIAITLVCGMIAVTRQLKYMQEQDLGFNASHKIIIPLRTESAKQNYLVLRNELNGLGSVKGVTATDYVPGSPIFSDFGLYPQGSTMEKAVLVKNNFVEPNYLDMLGIRIIAGKNFSEERNAESWRNVIVNRETVTQLGLDPEKIAGEELYFDWQGEHYVFNVIGVMENYNQESLKERIVPVLFRVDEKPEHDYSIAEISSANITQTIASIEKAWKAINADTPFEYTFLDENIQKQYDDDKRASSVIVTFTIIAMIISCLGLYGLSTYMAERRFKEIGIRKVMGATVGQIVAMISGEFTRLVLIAFAISVPLAWYAISSWLESFAYKTNISAMIYLGAGAGALAIAMITVSFESIKAASENPVKALRNE